ncbi:helix-turn-helix domain-containing protein [Dyella sp. KRB-257]|uniref:helix-turn-helix domain-containing protein n=1 Tax=Dyella sp. KRB-257 TaxID=3400915 RepID=UPI003C011C48
MDRLLPAQREQDSLGQQLRLLRKRRGLTQAALATRAGMPRPKIVQMEQDRGSIAFGSYARLAAALDAALKVDIAQRPTLEELGDIYGE